MLNGISPIIIFSTSLIPKPPLLNALSGLPVVGEAFSAGIPIPIYLDEQRTGIVVESETSSIDIDTNFEGKSDTSDSALVVSQSPIDSIVTVNMLANKNSLLLTVLLTLAETAFKKAVSKEYSITYLNGTTVIFGALLRTFATSVSADDDLIRITFQLSKGDPGSVISQVPILNRTAGAAIGG